LAGHGLSLKFWQKLRREVKFQREVMIKPWLRLFRVYSWYVASERTIGRLLIPDH
jgi:hypothetical protein